MAFKKNAEFIGYVEPPLTGEDILQIKDSAGSVEDGLLYIMQYAVENWLDFRLQYKDDDDRYHAVVYCNNPKSEYAGIGVRAKAKSPIDAVNALSLRLQRIGKTDLRTLVAGKTDDGDIA